MILQNFAAIELDVNVAAQKLFSIGDFKITNGMVTGFFGALITIAILVYTSQMVRRGKYNRFVGLIQWVFEGLLNQIAQVIPDKKIARKITPLAVTIFFLVLVNYWLSVLPGLDSLKINGVALLRSPAADLNFTVGLAIISMITVQTYAIKVLGVFKNAGRYLQNPFKNPIGTFEGLLELLGEFSRGLSLALRLFGNAFAGEILLVVIAVLSSFVSVAVLPIFIAFELLIGFIQAYVFFVLTLIFTALATAHEESVSLEHSTDIQKASASFGKSGM